MYKVFFYTLVSREINTLKNFSSVLNNPLNYIIGINQSMINKKKYFKLFLKLFYTIKI